MTLHYNTLHYTYNTKHTHTHTNKQTNKQKNTQAHKQTNKQTSKQANKQTHKQTNKHASNQAIRRAIALECVSLSELIWVSVRPSVEVRHSNCCEAWYSGARASKRVNTFL